MFTQKNVKSITRENVDILRKNRKLDDNGQMCAYAFSLIFIGRFISLFLCLCHYYFLHKTDEYLKDQQKTIHRQIFEKHPTNTMNEYVAKSIATLEFPKVFIHVNLRNLFETITYRKLTKLHMIFQRLMVVLRFNNNHKKL